MRYFIGFLITIGLIILLIVLLFGGGNSSKTPTTHKSLPDYASTDAITRLTIDGPINAAQNHNQIQISVGRDAVVYKALKGYNGDVVDQHTFINTENAYDNFLHALAVAGFTEGNNDPALQNEQGYCPTGDRYIFQLTQNGTDIERYWSTNCGGVHTYGGSTNLTLQLFEAQVPNFDDLTQNIVL